MSKENYIKFQKASGIKEGDTVRVTRKAASNECGWGNSWEDDMDDAVGKTQIVDCIMYDEGGIKLEDGWSYPYFALIIVKEYVEKSEIKENPYYHKPICLILGGSSGSGKSSLAEFLAPLVDADIVSADLFWGEDYAFDPAKLGAAHEWCKENFLESLSKGHSVFVDNTNTSKKEFEWYVDEAKKEGYTVSRIIVDNINGTESIHNVPEHVLERQKAKLIESMK